MVFLYLYLFKSSPDVVFLLSLQFYFRFQFIYLFPMILVSLGQHLRVLFWAHPSVWWSKDLRHLLHPLVSSTAFSIANCPRLLFSFISEPFYCLLVALQQMMLKQLPQPKCIVHLVASERWWWIPLFSF